MIFPRELMLAWLTALAKKNQNLYIKVSQLTLETKKTRPDINWKKSKKTKKWIDGDCENLKKGMTCGKRKRETS